MPRQSTAVTPEVTAPVQDTERSHIHNHPLLKIILKKSKISRALQKVHQKKGVASSELNKLTPKHVCSAEVVLIREVHGTSETVVGGALSTSKEAPCVEEKHPSTSAGAQQQVQILLPRVRIHLKQSLIMFMWSLKLHDNVLNQLH